MPPSYNIVKLVGKIEQIWLTGTRHWSFAGSNYDVRVFTRFDAVGGVVRQSGRVAMLPEIIVEKVPY